jgi:membrane associated rhomboid family serine protease
MDGETLAIRRLRRCFLRNSLKKNISAHDIPFGNYIVILLACITFALQFLYDYKAEYLTGLVLENWTIKAFFGHMWLHGNLLHIISNLVFLWVFGRHVCRRIGNANYPLAYIFVGLAGALAHMLYDGRPAIGASGAIMGILGMHLVICFKHFSPAGPWIILVWFLLNLMIGATNYFPNADIAYMAHIGGFFAGIVLANLMVMLDIAENNDCDPALIRLLQ